jgi:hypothetical protein
MMTFEEMRAFAEGEDNGGMRELQIGMAKMRLTEALVALNQSLAHSSKGSTAGHAHLIIQMFEEFRPLAVSNSICDQMIALFRNVADALTQPDLDKRTAAVSVIEVWHQDQPKFILDVPAFRKLALS